MANFSKNKLLTSLENEKKILHVSHMSLSVDWESILISFNINMFSILNINVGILTVFLQ